MQANVYARDYATGKSLLSDGRGHGNRERAYAEGGVGIEIVAVQTAEPVVRPTSGW